jgi:hypothetical protein
MTSKRRSPVSYLLTNDWGFANLAANSAWVMPTDSRAPRSASRKASERGSCGLVNASRSYGTAA